MRKKKIISLVLAAVLVMSLIGCGSSSSDSSSTTTESAAEETTEAAEEVEAVEEVAAEPTYTSDETATISILYNGDNTPNDTNIVLDALMEATGTKIEMTYTSKEDYATKMSTLIAAGDVPDLFYVSSIADVQRYKDAGILADWTDVLNDYGENIYNELGDNLYEVSVNNDGIYMIPNANKGYATNMNIRSDWLDNLGMEMPTDLDSLREVFNAFTYNDPDGNGVDDTYAYTFTFNNVPTGHPFRSIFGAYGIASGGLHTNLIQLDDGTVTTWVKDPHFLEAIEYIRDLIYDGVMEPDFMTIEQMESFEKLWIGTAGAIEWECVGPTNNWMPSRYTEDPVPTFDFAIIEGPYGDSGVAAVYPTLTAGWVMSADCENMEGVAKIANYLMTEEGNDLVYLGVEGVMYEWIDEENGEFQYLDEYVDSTTHRANGGYVYFGMFNPVNTTEIRTLNKQTQEGVQLAYDNGVDYIRLLEASEVYTDIGADLDQELKEMFADLLMAPEGADIQAIYDEHMEEWVAIGGEDWEADVTAMYADQIGG